MTFPSTDPHPTHPLADRTWRLRHSAWVLAPILGCGMLSFVGFLYVAIRVQSRRFWFAAGLGSLGSAAIWVVLALSGDLEESSDTASTAAESTDSMSDVGVAVTLAVWAALVAYAFVLNRHYLRWRSGRHESQAWYNQPLEDTGQSSGYTGAPVTHQPPPGPLGIDQRDYFAAPRQQAPPPAAGGGHVDVNTATAEALSTALGIDPSLAARVAAVRDRRSGFADLDDLVAAAGLQPHELLRFRDRVAFGHPAPGAAPHPSTPPPAPPEDGHGGRIIDI